MISVNSVQTRNGGVLSTCQVKRSFFPADAHDLQEAIQREEFYRRIKSYLERDIEVGGTIKASVPGNAYVINTGSSAIALVAATAKTVMYINSAAANQPSWVEWCIGFDGVTSTAIPALVETTYGTKASNSTPGTASTSFTPVQTRGWPTQASAQAAANACTSEPTVLVSQRQYLVSPYGGLLIMQLPMGRETTQVASGAAISGIQGGIRCNAPAIVNIRGYIEYEE
jgi:hypothetical protein